MRGAREMAVRASRLLLLPVLLAASAAGRGGKPRNDDFSLWIDEKQVREFSGFPMEIFAILDGVVLPYILDPNFEKYLPVIPSGVDAVNFTWKAALLLRLRRFGVLRWFSSKEPPDID